MTLFETDEPEQITFWTVFLTSTSLVTVVALLAIVIALISMLQFKLMGVDVEY